MNDMNRLKRIANHIKENKIMNDMLIDRELRADDYDKNVLHLLSQLSTVDEVSREKFNEVCDYYKKYSNIYYSAVIEDVANKKVIAMATLFISQKIMHSCGKCGHIEDVVVDSTYRGKRLGYRVVETLIQRAKAAGCYKVILNCSDKNIPFYQKLGFKPKENEMALYFE